MCRCACSAATVDADLKLAFEQNPKPSVRLSGVVAVSRVKLADAQQQDLLAFDHLKLDLADLRPAGARALEVASVELTAPTLTVLRARDGRLNLDVTAAPSGGANKKAKTVANNDHSTLGSGRKNIKKTAPDPWTVEVWRRSWCGAAGWTGLDGRAHRRGQRRARPA